MARSPDSLTPSAGGRPPVEKRGDKASESRSGGEANPRAATQVNAVAASSTPPTSNPAQLDLFPGRACPLKAKPATDRPEASNGPVRRDGVEGGGTRRQRTRMTGETSGSPTEAAVQQSLFGREAYKGSPRSRGPDAARGVGGGHSTGEPRENRGEGRAAASTTRSKRGKAAGLRPRGSASSRPKSARARRPKRMDPARKLQRTLYRTAHAVGRRGSESRIRENRTYGSMRGRWKRAASAAARLRSTLPKPLVGASLVSD